MVGYLVTGNRTSVPEVFPTCKVGPLAAVFWVKATETPALTAGVPAFSSL